uniref:RING-type domain-containing protein n=1 Tax=Populus davidiana TaxID=266767 RepID=A0A6M2ERE1_9ROSI
MGSSGSKAYRGGASSSSSSSGSGRKGKSKGRSKVFQSSCLGTSCGSRDSTSGDHVCDDGNKENCEGNASSTIRNEIDSDEVKIECYGKVKVEQSDKTPCISSDVELDEWNQASITNTSSRTGSSSARAAAPTQSLTFPSRLLSRLSFIPGNVSFRLSRAVSLGSSRAYQTHSTGPRMFDGEDEIRRHPQSANSVVDGNGNEIQQISDLLATSLVSRTAAHHHEDTAAALQLHSQAPDLLDNMQENQNIFSIRNSGRDGGGNRVEVDANLRSPRMFNDMDGIETRHSDRRIGAREPAERNVRFSRTLSVGRLRDRVLRRSSLAELTFCPLQQEREMRGSSQGSGRQAVGGEMRVPESEGNTLTSTTALGYPSSGMSSSLFSIQDHELETSRTREARYRDLLEHRSNFLERRRRIRSQVRALQRLGSRFENLSGHERSCILSGQHRTGRCTCRVNNRDANLNDDTNARASISRIVMLAEALFEVLDEIHQQSVVLSSRPSMSSLGSVPAPNEIVESLPVKLYAKSQKHQNEDTAQCYICLVEYEEGDSMRVLPCHHEFHRTCVDKWLKEIHRVCPLCRGDICRSDSLPTEN